MVLKRWLRWAIFVVSGTLLVFLTAWTLKSFGILDLIVDWWGKRGGENGGQSTSIQSGDEVKDS